MVFFCVTVSYLAFLVFCEGMGSFRLILSKSFLAFLKPLIHLQTLSWGAVLSLTLLVPQGYYKVRQVFSWIASATSELLSFIFQNPRLHWNAGHLAISQMIPQHRCLLLSFVNFLVLIHLLKTLVNCLLYSLPPLLQDHHWFPEPQGQALTP